MSAKKDRATVADPIAKKKKSTPDVSFPANSKKKKAESESGASQESLQPPSPSLSRAPSARSPYLPIFSRSPSLVSSQTSQAFNFPGSPALSRSQTSESTSSPLMGPHVKKAKSNTPSSPELILSSSQEDDDSVDLLEPASQPKPSTPRAAPKKKKRGDLSVTPSPEKPIVKRKAELPSHSIEASLDDLFSPQPQPNLGIQTSKAPSVPPQATLPAPKGKDTTWSPAIAYTCVPNVCQASFKAEHLLYKHYIETHCADGVSLVDEREALKLGFEICAACSNIFRKGLVHKDKKCPYPVHVEEVVAARMKSRKELLQQAFATCAFGSLDPGVDMPTPTEIFTQFTPTLDYFPGGEELQGEFRRVFIVIVKYLKDNKSTLTPTQWLHAWILLFALPKLLLAIPFEKSPDRLASTAAVVHDRINRFLSCKFSELNTQLREITESLRTRPDDPHRPNTMDATVKKVIGFIKKQGGIGKAGRRLESDCSVADLTDPNVVEEIKTLLIQDASYSEPHCIIKPGESCPVLHVGNVNQAIGSMMPSAPGFSAWGQVIFKVLNRSEEGRSALTYVANAIYAKALPEELNHLITFCTLTPLQKPHGGIRPICAADGFIRLIAKCTVILEQTVIAKTLEPLQVAVGTRGGTEIAIHAIRSHLDAHPQHIAVAIDLRNAFGSVHRHAIATALNIPTYESSKFSRWFFNNFGAPESNVALRSGETLTYNRGVPQGGPTSMQWFCHAIQPLLILANSHLKESNGLVISYADDTFLLGEPIKVFEAFQKFTEKAVDFGLQPRSDKCRILAPSCTLTQAELTMASHCGLPQRIEPALIVLGTPVGAPDREAQLADELINDDLISRKLAYIDNIQCRTLILRYCIATKYNHLARTLPPDQAKKCLNHIDQRIAEALQILLEEEKALPSDVLLQISLPLRVGGLSLKNLEQESNIDYYASASASLMYWHNNLDKKQFSIHNDPSSRSSKAIQSALDKCHSLLTLVRETQSKVLVAGKNLEQYFPDLPKISLPKDVEKLLDGVSASSKLQRSLSQFHARATFRFLIEQRNTPSARRQLLDNSTSSPSLALRAIPTEPGLQLTDKAFRIMLRTYLSLPLERTLGLPEKRIRCACASKDKEPTYAEGDHLFNCNKQSNFSQRHEAIKSVLVSAVNSVGIHVAKERKVSPSDSQKRLDLVIAPFDESSRELWVDVTIASHVSKEITKGRATLPTTPLFAAECAIKTKRNKYKNDINLETQEFVPLAAQCNGALHNDYRKTLYRLSKLNRHCPPVNANSATPTYCAYWAQRINCTLWQGTANALINVATQSMAAAGRLPEDVVPKDDGGPDSYILLDVDPIQDTQELDD